MPSSATPKILKGEIFFGFFKRTFIPHCFICRPSNSTVSEDAGIESRTVAIETLVLAVRRSDHPATYHPQNEKITKKCTVYI
jgi:hypothetical protein